MIVPRHLVGYVDTTANPAAEPGLLGAVTLSPEGPVQARSHTTLTLRYTVGQHGLDDRGAFKILMRFPMDGGVWQFTDPAAANYVTITSTGDCAFQGLFESFGDARPWFKVMRARVVGGCLRRGEVVTITLGDTSGGGPGLRMQTFCEDALELRFLVDVCATGHFVELPQRLAFPVVPGPAAAYRAVLPTRWTADAPFRLGVKAEDAWGNPTDQAGVVRLVPSMPVDGLPETLDLSGRRAVTIEGLTAAAGDLTVAVHAEDGTLLTTSSPLHLSGSSVRSYWGDLHGQSGETVGINSAERYFAFARDLAFLDISSHQGNAFQINGAFWRHLNDLTASLNTPGRFLAIPGYEWSGNTAVGGDRNVYFRSEHRPVRRSSHALLTDRSDIGTDCTDANMLFEALQFEDVFAYAHVGGRYADIALAHDGRIERSVEIHSAWGTFEWLLLDALALGHRVGVVANSDGHKGRPGASYPGAATFGAYGGLTCFHMESLTRDALFDCVRRRHHYGTTGARIDVTQTVRFDTPSRLFDEDPALDSDAASSLTDEATMGDIVQTDAEQVAVSFTVAAASAIERVAVRVGAETVATLRPDAPVGQRVRLLWQGAKYRGRGRAVRWDGSLSLAGATLTRAERINAWNPEHAFTATATTASWQAITTGNFGGLDLWIVAAPGATLTVTTPHCTATLALSDIGTEDTRIDAGGLDMALRLFRLPDATAGRRSLSGTVDVRLAPTGDTPIWLVVTCEDGHQAFTSPTHVFRSQS